MATKPKKETEPVKIKKNTYDTPNEGKPKTQKKDTAEKVVKRYETARQYINDFYLKTWEDSWKIYNNERTTKAQYYGVANNTVPETFTIVESIKANILGGEQKFEYFPTRDDQKADTTALNALVEHYWYTNSFPKEAMKWIQDDVVLGTGFLWSFWDEDRGIIPMYVPLQDNFVDPTASNYDTAEYAGFRYLTTVEELESQMTWDEEKGEMVQRFKNLNRVKKTSRNDDDDFDKELKDNLHGSTLGKEAKERQVEVIYCIDKERLIQVANRQVVIEDVETPFKREETEIESFDDLGNPVPVTLPEIPAFLPFAPARNYIDGSLFYARGDVEVILPSQELLNDTSSQKTDNLTYIVNKVALIDPAYADEGDQLDMIPGGKWYIPPGAVEWLNQQPIGADADNEMLRIVDTMRRATAADEIIQGKGSGGRTTATEIRAQLAQAGTRFSIKLKNLEREGLKILADNMFKLIQIHIDQETAVRTIGPKGAEFHTFNPGEYLGDYEPRVMLDTTAMAVKEEEKQNAMQFFQMAAEMPFVDQQELFKQTARKMFELDDMEIEALIQQQQPPMMDPMMAQQGMEPGMGGQDMPPEQLDAMNIMPPEGLPIDSIPAQ